MSASAPRTSPGRLRLLLFGFGALGLLLVALLAATTARGSGDYLVGLVPERHLALRMTPWPQARVLGDATLPMVAAAPRGAFFGGLGGGVRVLHPDISLLVFAPPSGAAGGGPVRAPIAPVLDPMAGAPGMTHIRMPDPDDEPWIERFERDALAPVTAAWVTRDFAALLAAAERLADAEPDRVTPHFWAVECLLILGRPEEARARLAACEARLRADASGRGPAVADLLALEVARASRPGFAAARRATAAAAPHASPTRPVAIEDRVAALRALAASGHAAPFYLEGPVGNWTGLHATWQEASQHLPVMVAGGDRDGAHEVLLGLLALALPDRPTPNVGEEMQRVAGLARVLQIAERTCFEQEAGVADADRAARLERQWAGWCEAWGRAPAAEPRRAWQRALSGHSELAAGSLAATGELQHAATLARWRLFAAAYRLEHHRLATGSLPAAPERGSLLDALLLPAGIPSGDPYDPAGGPLRVVVAPDALVIYSIGPDGVDDGGTRQVDLKALSAGNPRPSGDLVWRLAAGAAQP